MKPADRDRQYRLRERREIVAEVKALRRVLLALVPLDFDERRRLLRWACERYLIDPAKLGQT